MTTLRFAAKGDFFSELADVHGISRSSVCKSISKVCESLSSRLNSITFPTVQRDIQSIKEGFHSVAGFPNVIGAIDGTLINIVKPYENPHLYVGRKGLPSINVMAVCDHKMRSLFKTKG